MKKGFSMCGKTSQENPFSGPVLALYGIAVFSKTFVIHIIAFDTIKI
jgi:hypothetical protein